MDVEGIIAYDQKRKRPASEGVYAALRTLDDKPHWAPQAIQALLVEKDREIEGLELRVIALADSNRALRTAVRDLEKILEIVNRGA